MGVHSNPPFGPEKILYTQKILYTEEQGDTLGERVDRKGHEDFKRKQEHERRDLLTLPTMKCSLRGVYSWFFLECVLCRP